jgi:SH3 domain-containing YSC84-like protein 1
MRRMIATATLLAALLLLGACSQRHVTTSATGKTVYGEKAEVIQRLNEAAEDLRQLINAPDAGIPMEVLDNAKCVAIVPTLVKGGFVFGARHGRGVTTCRTANGWSDPAFFVVTGASWGAQIGVESVDLVMLAMNDRGMRDLMQNEVELGAGASVAAGPVGRQAQVGTDWKAETGLLMYSRARGLFAGLELSGAAVRHDLDSTVAFYGKPIPAETLLTGKGPNLPDAKKFIQTVASVVRRSKQAEAEVSGR